MGWSLTRSRTAKSKNRETLTEPRLGENLQKAVSPEAYLWLSQSTPSRNALNYAKTTEIDLIVRSVTGLGSSETRS